MKKPVALAFALTLAAMTPAIRQAYAAPQTFNGTVTDSMCGIKHMMPGKSAADCVRECVKAGSSYVLVSDGKMYKLAAKPQTLAEFAGKHVSVAGSLAGNKITVSSIAEAK
jgi:hypothetical protein